MERHGTRGWVPVKVVTVGICVQTYLQPAIQLYPTRNEIDCYAIFLPNSRAKPINARYTTGKHTGTFVIVPACVEDDVWEADVAEFAYANDSDIGGGEGGGTWMDWNINTSIAYVLKLLNK